MTLNEINKRSRFNRKQAESIYKFMFFVSLKFLDNMFLTVKDIIDPRFSTSYNITAIRVKHLTKDCEKNIERFSSEKYDEYEDDAGQMFDICQELVIATLRGKEAEFLEHVKKFNEGVESIK